MGMTAKGALVAIALAMLAIAFMGSQQARGHDWFPYSCCSGADCRGIGSDIITTTPQGFFIKESGETLAYDSEKIRKTPPEGGGLYYRCSREGKAETETICLYIPNWGT